LIEEEEKKKRKNTEQTYRTIAETEKWLDLKRARENVSCVV